MSTNDTRAEKRTGAKWNSHVQPTHQPLGVDQNGDLYHLDRRSRRVHRVAPETGQRRVIDLDAVDSDPHEALQTVMQTVAGERGWRRRQLYLSADIWAGIGRDAR
jgi:hypothetical protein